MADLMKRDVEKLYASMEGSVFIGDGMSKIPSPQPRSLSSLTASKHMAASSYSLNSTSSSSMTQSSMTKSTSSMSQSSTSMSSFQSSSSISQSSMTKFSSSMSQSAASLTQSAATAAITHSTQSQQAIEQQAVVTEVLQQSTPVIKEITTVERSPVTVTRTAPSVTVKETIVMSTLEAEWARAASHRWHTEEWVSMGSTEAVLSGDDVIVIRQFDFAPSPIKEIKLFTSVTVDPPVETVLQMNKKAVHLTSASLITIEKGELKLVREEIEEDEGMFEEFWEEVRVQQYEEELRRTEHRRMMMQEHLEITRRTQEKRSQLLKRVEETKGIYSYGGRRSYAASYSSVDSPFSYRTVGSPYSFE